MKIRFISYLTIVLAALLLGACNSIMDDEVCADQPSDTTTPVQIGFTLTTGDVSSRVTEGEEAGTGYENYIDIEDGDFRILLFDATNDTYLTTFEPTSIRPADNTEYPQTYYVEGELSETYDNNFKLVAEMIVTQGLVEMLRFFFSTRMDNKDFVLTICCLFCQDFYKTLDGFFLCSHLFKHFDNAVVKVENWLNAQQITNQSRTI